MSAARAIRGAGGGRRPKPTPPGGKYHRLRWALCAAGWAMLGASWALWATAGAAASLVAGLPALALFATALMLGRR